MARGRRRLGVAQVAERDDAGAGVVVDGEQPEVLVVEVGRGRAERPGRLGLGAEDRPDAVRVGPAGEVGLELGAGLVAVVGVLGHQLADDRGERRGDAAGDLLQRLGVVHPLLEDLVDDVAPLERRPARRG